MKPFSERNLFVIGAIGIAVTVAIVVGAINYNKLPFLNQGKEYSAYFAEAGGLTNAIVFLAGAVPPREGGNSPRQPELVDQRGCEYLPPVLALRAGTEIEIRNSDPLLHNVRANNSSPLFNFAMPVQGLKVRKQLPPSPITLHLACDVHPWMHAVIRTFDHPYFAITDARGRYRLPDVPSGRQKVTFWHQRFPEKTIEVEALGSAPNAVDFAWPASELRL